VTISYQLTPIPKWYIADLAGKPLGAGYMETFSSLDHNVVKLVYQDAAGATPWPAQIDFDANGSQGPFYWKLDTDNPLEKYYIRVYDINGVFQWDIDDYTPEVDPVTPPSSRGLENLIVNNVMINNFGASANPIASTAFKIASGAHSKLAQTSSNFSPDIWFIKNNLNATDQLSFVDFTLGDNPFTPDITPGQYLRYVCTAAGAGETTKKVQFPITQNVQNLTEQEVTFSIWIRCNSGSALFTASLIQFFGDGAGASTSVTTTITLSDTLGVSWKQLTGTVTIPSVSGKTIGGCYNDGLFLALNYPQSTTTSIDFTKPCLYVGEVTLVEEFQTNDKIEAVTNSNRTGDIIVTWATNPRFGYVPANDGSIGTTGTGATTRSNRYQKRLM